ncbi:uncharacterized protein LOC121425337 [Lytechinus variegatus]|uniref:uncharacterized protein LOC121425337 n=1 Tax=Lytechinus variegatus TaxID=7654 RepID=UPI001BB23771|nr:uncharacterized protein LOC121425337 [Lytechinus variegatus]
MHGFIRPFNMSVHLDDRNLPPVRRHLYDCEGSESTLEHCARRNFNSNYTPSVAGVLCSDDGGTLLQFPILNGDNKILRIAKNVDNPQWLILCTQRDSHLAHLACQQTGRLFALRDGLDQPPGNILLAVENEPCNDPVIQACNVTTHLVEHANCSDYGVIPVLCSDKMGYRLFGHLVNVCEEDLCQSFPHNSSNGRRSCYCDSLCEFYGDCCFDYVTECIYGFNSSTVLYEQGYSKEMWCTSNDIRPDIRSLGHEGIEGPQLQCIEIFMISDWSIKLIEIHHYLLVAKCHRDWSGDNNILNNCEKEWIPGIPERALIPHYYVVVHDIMC